MRGDTICALCTPRGKGAISLIRISGPKALEITKKLAGFLPSKPETHKAYFGTLKFNQKALDQVLLTYFAKGKSFTGEESLEISCHGGGIYNKILKTLLQLGARLAEKGEFSLQALSNGKMDLVQAEGLLQFIESESEPARNQAFSQLRGQLSKKLQEIEKNWLYLLSHLEADIDFSLEALNTLDDKKIKELLENLEQEVKRLLSSYKPYENLQKGLLVGIFGRVNSGKSSLFNALLSEQKAIVSSEEGTTRDLVSATISNPEGLSICLTDSAGFRKSQSEGENKGQKKAKELFTQCDYKILLLDSLCFEKEPIEESLFEEPKKSLLVFTKKDLLDKKTSIKDLLDKLNKKHKVKIPPKEQVFFLSALTGEGLSSLKEKILSFGKLHQEDFLISNYRHYKGLKLMEESLEKSLSILSSQAEKDIMALELRQGLQSLYEILGKQIDDKVLDSIFKQFCIGK